MNCRRLLTADKKISIYPAAAPGGAVVYLNTAAGEGGQVYESLLSSGCPDFTLVTISGLDWNHDMSPWKIPPISEGDAPCTGGADEYLRFLTEQVLPQAENRISGKPLWRGIAGYSLAGLFALYSVYRTDLFSRVASVSGSLWFPDFKEYALSHAMKGRADHLYFSLGDREYLTKNPFLKSVQENTEALASFYKQSGLDAIFELNPGNHFKNPVQRTAAGISWILSR